MYYKGKWCTAGGKDPLFGHVDGFQIGPKSNTLLFCDIFLHNQIVLGIHTTMHFLQTLLNPDNTHAATSTVIFSQ